MNAAPLFSNAPSNPATALDDLIETVRDLLAEGGCPWNREQTHESLAKYLVEETAETVDAIEAGTPADVKEELGDVLYQVLFHAQLAENANEGYSIQEIAAATNAKMRRRHPHVFGDDPATTIPEIEQMWQRVKAEEKSERTSVLDGVPRTLPSLALAEKLIGRAESIGVLDRGAGGGVALEDEHQLGQLLLAVVASARSRGLDAERALRTTLREFEQEIRDAESMAADAGVIGLADNAIAEAGSNGDADGSE